MKPNSISATIPNTVSTILPIGPSVEMAGSRIRKNAPFSSSSCTRLRTFARLQEMLGTKKRIMVDNAAHSLALLYA